MIELRLPRLVGTREAVEDLLDDQGVSDALDGQTVFVQCRNLAAASPSFADELVAELLERRNAIEIILVASPGVFTEYVTSAASKRHIQAQVKMQSASQLTA